MTARSSRSGCAELVPDAAGKGPEIGRQLHSTALKKRSARHVQKYSIDRPADENMIRSARPIRYSAGTKPTPPTAWRKAAVLAVVAVVAHEEVVALGHREDVGVVGEPILSMFSTSCVRPSGQASVGGSVSVKRLAVQMPPSPTGPFSQRGILAHAGPAARTLPRRRRRHLRHFLAVEEEDAVLHLHRVARQADQPLDEIRPVDRMAEHHDIAALGLRSPGCGPRSDKGRRGRSSANSHRPSC